MSTPARRRARFAAAGAVVLGATVASVVLANVLAARAGVRWDATATGEHRLAQRTTDALRALDRPHRLVIAADMTALDPRARDRVLEVVAEMDRVSEPLAVTVIDTASPAGPAAFASVVQDLARAHGGAIARRAKAAQAAREAALGAAEAIESRLGPAFDALRAAAPEGAEGSAGVRRFAEDRAAETRLAAQDLRAAADAARAALDRRVSGIALPDTAGAIRSIRERADPALSMLDTLDRDLGRVNPAAAESARRAAADLRRAAAGVRDALALAVDALRTIPPSDAERAVQALSAGVCVLVIADPAGDDPGRVGAVDPEALFPAAAWLDAAGAARADVRRRAEELLSTALASLGRRDLPIVVLTHAERQSITNLFRVATDRLAMRGIDTLEWRVLESPDRLPDASPLDPSGRRPRVYLSVAPDSSSGGEPAGARRAAMLGAALQLAADSGAGLFLSMNPSVIPAAGQPDPVVAALAGFGLEAQTGRPVIAEQLTPAGRAIITEQTVTLRRGEHPVAAAVGDLSTLLTWPVAITPADGASAQAAVIGALPAGDAAWAESQWLTLWQTPAAQRSMMRPPPEFNEGRDRRLAEYPVVVAAERSTPAGPRRVLAVGSNAWLVDPVVGQQAEVDGRRIDVYPGNLELLEAGVFWLAGQDELIARSVAAQSIATVRSLSPATLVWLRLALIAGLPTLVIALMLITRAARG